MKGINKVEMKKDGLYVNDKLLRLVTVDKLYFEKEA